MCAISLLSGLTFKLSFLLQEHTTAPHAIDASWAFDVALPRDRHAVCARLSPYHDLLAILSGLCAHSWHLWLLMAYQQAADRSPLKLLSAGAFGMHVVWLKS